MLSLNLPNPGHFSSHFFRTNLHVELSPPQTPQRSRLISESNSLPQDTRCLSWKKKIYIYLPICRIKFVPWTKNQHKKIWNIVQFLSYSTHSLNADVWDCGITEASRPILDVSSLRKSIKFFSTYQRTVIW